MSLQEDIMRHVPDYYDYMYMDGFTPDEIMYAARKKMNREFEEQKRKQQEELMEKLLEKKLEKQIEEFIEKTLDELLKDFGK